MSEKTSNFEVDMTEEQWKERNRSFEIFSLDVIENKSDCLDMKQLRFCCYCSLIFSFFQNKHKHISFSFIKNGRKPCLILRGGNL